MKLGIQTTAAGAIDQIDIDLALSAEAQSAGAKHPLAYLDNKIQVAPGLPSPRQQAYMQMGYGRKDLSLKDALAGTAAVQAGLTGPAQQSGDVTGRLTLIAYLFDAIENKLREGDGGMTSLFSAKAAQVDSINNTKFDRPIINMSAPEAGRSRSIAQLALPASMMTLTVSDTSYKIPGTSIGLEYSDQAAASVSLPIVAMSVTRQAEVEALARIEGYITGFLNGDADFGMGALASVAGAVKNAKVDYDGTLAVGALSQKAWVGWLFNGSRKRKVDTVITDLAGALAIEGRSGRPTVTTDNATSPRIDVGMSVANPTWSDKVDLIITTDPSWPVNTIMGFDHRYGYHLVNSTMLAYEAMEQYALRRSTAMRFDSGSVAYRLYDDAWSVLTLS